MECMNKVGHHIEIGKSLIETLKNKHSEFGNVPFQIFSGSPRTRKVPKYSKSEIAEIRDFVDSEKIALFVHMRYCINICSEDEAGIKCLINDLQFARNIHAKGLVVHTGQRVKRSEEVAIQNMFLNVMKLLEFATQECQVLLETPCGEGTEICAKVEDLYAFFQRFSGFEMKLGICIDTCHVFASGISPLEYIQTWEILRVQNSTYPEICEESDENMMKIVENLNYRNFSTSWSIKLVHFNDSFGIFGSRKDKHAYPGFGEIGSEVMNSVMSLCETLGIPMLTEIR